ESGIAIIVALLVLLILSVMAAGVMFNTQTEIWTSSNFRSVTQARYVAEAGAQQAGNWLMNTYAVPNFAADNKWNLNVFPVTYNGNPVVFSSVPGVTATYGGIDSTSNTSFNSAFSSISSPFTGIKGSASFSVAVQLLAAETLGSGTILRW